MKRIVLGLGLFILLLFLFANNRFFETKLKLISSLNRLPQTLSETEEQKKIAELEKENKNLKFQLLNEKIKKPSTVKVYSAYPFSNRGQIAIAAGDKSGVKVGDVITYGDNILVGKVTKVFDASSIVTTIFDPSWKSAVRIGEHEVDALLQGGNELTVTLIPGEAEIHEGELVIAASQDLPYGLGLGTIKNIRSAPGNAFKEGVLEPGFQFKQLKNVSIYR
ncbi:MAG: rod shape-determining protein MreC [Candidatus Colwellbacteria bacterium]|nr:rod shape-determining protein MreC [Candidatus Colwellbacteria bacterium]